MPDLTVKANAAGIAGDRRQDRRYEIQLELRWKLIRRRRVLESGIGRTIDLSSGGIQFETDRPLPAGANLELSIAWPTTLGNLAPLQLLVSGRIVRSNGRRAAIRNRQHQFRTARMSAEQRATGRTQWQPPGALLIRTAVAAGEAKMN